MTTDPKALPTAVEWAHWLLTSRVKPGDCVVDATAGNGHDTLFLAQLVGPEGRVFAFDIQAAAVLATQSRLTDAGVKDRCEVIHCGHHELSRRLPAQLREGLAAVMFNLGWLPGHDKECITQTATTMEALAQALDWIKPGGLLTVVVYPGHAGGDDESNTIAAWATGLPSNTHEVRHVRSPNRNKRSPECWAIRKRESKVNNRLSNTSKI